jgi:hypothetical protein
VGHAQARRPRIDLPTKQAFGAMWAIDQDDGTLNGNKAGWLALDGEVVGQLTNLPNYQCAINGVAYHHTPAPLGAIANGDGVLFSARAFAGTSGYDASSGWLQLSAAGNLGLEFGSFCGSALTPKSLVRLGDFVTGLWTLPSAFTLETLETSVPGSQQASYPLAGGAVSACVLGEDGELLATACIGDEGGAPVVYRRMSQNGSVFYENEVLAGGHTPIGIGRSADRPGRTPQVGVVTRDGANNLWFFVRDANGESVIEPAIIAGGETVGQAVVLHDGNDFIVVWLAKVQGIEQAFGQRVTCE